MFLAADSIIRQMAPAVPPQTLTSISTAFTVFIAAELYE
jgi:hypothetical protein